MNTLNPSAAPTAAARPAGPNRARFMLLVLIGVYPLITAISYAIAPLTAGWDIWQRGLVLTPIMAAIMVYFLIPFIQTRFRGWLMK